MGEKTKIKNECTLILFATLIGAFASIVFWCFLWAVNFMTECVWDKIPAMIGAYKFYPVVVGLFGGLLLGVLRKFWGDYPENMQLVLGTVKKTGTYPYKKLPYILILAILSLMIGSSVGPEAGMVGVIVALCCWAGENLRFARKSVINYSKIGAAVSLSMIFHSPLFGIFEVEESESEPEVTLSKASKWMVYGIAMAAGVGVFAVLSKYVCAVSEGFPSFEIGLPEGLDYLLMIGYILAGILLGYFFIGTEIGLEKLAGKIPPILKETLAGLILGLCISFIPAVSFSGEEQMGELIAIYATIAPLALVGFALVKVVLTNLCIQFGLKGGHFFPLIFSAVCLGYGLSLMVYPGLESHAIFAAAIVAAATLGVTLKKPLAVTLLLFLCFPVRMVFWLFLSAAIASYVGNLLSNNKKEKTNEGKHQEVK